MEPSLLGGSRPPLLHPQPMMHLRNDAGIDAACGEDRLQHDEPQTSEASSSRGEGHENGDVAFDRAGVKGYN